MDLGLEGKIALVTASSRGLGFAAARTLSREGALVAINARHAKALHGAAEKISRETNNRLIALPGDVADPHIPEQLVKQVISEYGALDILITNAGGPPSASFEDLDDPAWQRAVDLTLMSHVRLIRAALPYLRRSNSASVLTITSLSAKQPIPNLVLSNSLRAAVIGFTKSLALELGRDGIRFNSILPGWTSTERIEQLLGERAATHGTTIDEEKSRQSQEISLGRLADPQEFANAAVFLVSPAASYITGVMLNVDGGAYKGTL